MSIEVISIGSSSSGNSYIIRAGGRTILLDVGLTAKKIVGALTDNGLAPEDVDAVFITHEHVDHVKSVRAVCRKCCNADFYATRGTVLGTANFAYVPDDRLHIVSAGDTLIIGETGESAADDRRNVRVDVFEISHDAREPVSYAFTCGGEKAAVVTDTGIITDEIYDAIRDSDKLVFESNHDEGLLMYGEYPYPVKVRIKGDHGHLSNKYAGETLARILADRRGTGRAVRPSGPNDSAAGEPRSSAPLAIMLAHLSFHNNAPYYARNTIEPILKENGFVKDADYTLTIAAKDETTIF
ncbi:MAG: MBL fold metallo-hydrolase [Mogibacterium sp.]|nr:MBL fold metallo-hydrolase [Mogibacterium sp.]